MTRLNMIRHACILAIVSSSPGVVAASAQAAPDLLPGTYRCSAYNVSGGGGSCRNMPSLVLDPDGSYRFSSTRGRWSSDGGKLLLSEDRLWGTGELLGSNTVRFEYDYRGWHHTVTWVCQKCAPANRGGENQSNVAYVGVSITLQFSKPVSGVSGFAIIPAEFARNYSHNAPLPKGAVQGLAWETGPNSVAIATNRNNMIVSGRQYVIFLDWPRESIPVAILEVPQTDRDYTATLPATLDGASVLAQLGHSSLTAPSGASDSGPPSRFPQAGPSSVNHPSASNMVADSGSGLQDFMNTVNDLGKAFDGLRGRGKTDRNASDSGVPQPSPPPAYPPGQSSYPGPDPSAYPAAQPAYAAPPQPPSYPPPSAGYPGDAPPQSYQPAQPAYPGPDPSASYPPPSAAYPNGAPPPSYPAASPGYPAGGASPSYPSAYPPPPAPADQGRSVQGYGPPPDAQMTAPPSQQPKCHPLIPKYSQPGCIE